MSEREPGTPWAVLRDGVSWKSPPLVSFVASRSLLVGHLGEPVERSVDTNGLGPADVWALRFRCGLEITVFASLIANDGRRRAPDEGTHVEILANDADVEHIVAHIPFPPGELGWWGDPPVPRERKWRVLRQDDNGQRFVLGSFSSRCEAERVVAEFESRGHKQTYWAEPIATTAGQ